MSGPMSNPTHVVIASTRRSWTREQKQAISAEAKNPATTVSAVARRHGVRTEPAVSVATRSA